jgi:membrane fusion protein (multidrug efflux system)
MDVPRSADLLVSFGQEEVAALVLGPSLVLLEAHSILTSITAQFPDNAATIVLIGVGPDPSSFQSFIDADRVFYLSRGPMTGVQIRSIIVAAIGRFRAKAEGPANGIVRYEACRTGVLDYCDRLSCQPDIPDAGGLLVEAVCNLVNADRSEYLICDPENESLWSIDLASRRERTESAAAGVVGYVARTGERVQIDRLCLDPRFDAEADDPGGTGQVQFVALPIPAPAGSPAGVVTAIRDGTAPAFSQEEVGIIELLAACAGSTLSAIMLRECTQKLLLEKARSDSASADLFRQEALNHFSRSWDADGDVLKASPAWLRRTHWVTVALLLAGLIYLVAAKVDELAAGPALVQARSKIAVVAPAGGLVNSVGISSGDDVRLGTLLVRFQNQPGAMRLDRFRSELRAPAAGVVSGLRVRPGQQLAPGDQVASIIDTARGYELVALLPGSYAPQLRQGAPLIFKFDGYSNSREVASVAHVGTEIISPREAALEVGTDVLIVPGPVVIVRAFLPASGFSAGGRSYSYRDGMTATAEVSIGSEPMIVSLVPGLRNFFRTAKR